MKEYSDGYGTDVIRLLWGHGQNFSSHLHRQELPSGDPCRSLLDVQKTWQNHLHVVHSKTP